MTTFRKDDDVAAVEHDTATATAPAAYLRTAASTLRERSSAATPGLWQHMCMGSDGCLVLRRHGTIRERGRGRVARFGHKDWRSDHADAEYVATMAPPVAEALAVWLDAGTPCDHGCNDPEEDDD